MLFFEFTCPSKWKWASSVVMRFAKRLHVLQFFPFEYLPWRVYFVYNLLSASALSGYDKGTSLNLLLEFCAKLSGSIAETARASGCSFSGNSEHLAVLVQVSHLYAPSSALNGFLVWLTFCWGFQRTRIHEIFSTKHEFFACKELFPSEKSAEILLEYPSVCLLLTSSQHTRFSLTVHCLSVTSMGLVSPKICKRNLY